MDIGQGFLAREFLAREVLAREFLARGFLAREFLAWGSWPGIPVAMGFLAAGIPGPRNPDQASLPRNPCH